MILQQEAYLCSTTGYGNKDSHIGNHKLSPGIPKCKAGYSVGDEIIVFVVTVLTVARGYSCSRLSFLL